MIIYAARYLLATAIAIYSVSAFSSVAEFSGCPRLLPLISASVHVAQRPHALGSEYYYSVENFPESLDRIAAFGIIGAYSGADQYVSPKGWHLVPGKNVVEWIPIAPAKSPSAMLAPGFASDKMIAPGSSEHGFSIASPRKMGLVLYKIGIGRDIKENLSAYRSWFQSQGDMPTDGDQRSEAFQEAYAGSCGPISGAIPQIYRYGVIEGPSDIPTLRAVVYRLPGSQLLSLAVDATPLYDQLAKITELVIMNAEQKRDISVGRPSFLPSLALLGTSALSAELRPQALASFSCRTEATLVAIKVGKATIANAKISGEDIGLPSSCLD